MDYHAQSFEELRNQTCKGRVDLFIFNNILMTLLVYIQNQPSCGHQYIPPTPSKGRCSFSFLFDMNMWNIQSRQ